jgi:hypothetical protein
MGEIKFRSLGFAEQRVLRGIRRIVEDRARGAPRVERWMEWVDTPMLKTHLDWSFTYLHALLKTLSRRRLVKVGRYDGRTYCYRLTAAGRRWLDHHDALLEESYHRVMRHTGDA